jgi:carboxyl-terminal processing protease
MKQSLFLSVKLIAVMLLLCAVCLGSSLSAQTLSEPEKNFEQLWKILDMNYAIFGPRHIDWQALYRVYRPRVTPKTTDDELFAIMSDMLGHLNDNHVTLTSQTPERFFCAGFLGEYLGSAGIGAFREMMSHRPVPGKYFKKALKETGNGVFAYGWASENIGYFHFNGFGNIPKSTEAIDTIIKEFKDADAIIVDVRKNGGGDDLVGKLIADRFADRKRLYMTTQIRSGLKHDDFTPKKYWYVEPDGPVRFTKPVILLTNRLSISAAENFALAMRVLPHVTVVGDFTSGCFADRYQDTLPNGWNIGVSYKLFLDYTGFCWEGIGVPPDIRQLNSDTDKKQQGDRVFELAVTLLRKGALKPQDERESLKNIRESLSETLEKAIHAKGLEAAVTAFRQTKQTKDPSGFTIDFEEMQELGRRLIGFGKVKEGLRVLELNAQEFPGLPECLFSLGQAYMGQGMKKQALEYYDKSMTLNQRRNKREMDMHCNAVLAKALLTGGVDRIAQAFRKLKDQYSYLINAGTLNNFGYLLLNTRMVKAAIAVFDLNVKTYPDYANGYDSLGEAYMVNGDKVKAAENYEKALKMDPQNKNAEAMLKKLREK